MKDRTQTAGETMVNDTIELAGTVAYNENYPPKGARKGYVAKITGRKAGAVKYERAFLGKIADLYAGDEGLYERQRGDKKGGFTRWYHVVLSHPGHGLVKSTDCEDEAPRIARMLDDGHPIEDIVEIVNLRPSKKDERLMVFDVCVIAQPKR